MAAQTHRTQKYVPNLSGLLALCEHNYVALVKLLPDCDTEDLRFRFSAADKRLSYHIVIQECSRYTTTLEFRQCAAGAPEYLQPVMQVRLYHDAKMAEVLRFQHISRIQPSYQYPNAQMLHKNEKEQVNLFLAEWLRFCRKQQIAQSTLAE